MIWLRDTVAKSLFFCCQDLDRRCRRRRRAHPESGRTNQRTRMSRQITISLGVATWMKGEHRSSLLPAPTPRFTTPRALAETASVRHRTSAYRVRPEVSQMVSENAPERFRLAQKLISVKQDVAQAITEEFFLNHPSGWFATANVGASSAPQMRVSCRVSRRSHRGRFARSVCRLCAMDS